MPFVFRGESDTDNPIAVRAYGTQITAGRLIYYKPAIDGIRTAFMTQLCEGARDLGDDGIDRIIKAYVAGFEIPEFDNIGARNWRLHPGTITARPTLKAFTVNTATDIFTSAAHGYANGTQLRVATNDVQAGGLISDFAIYFVISATTNTFQLSLTAGGAAIDIGPGAGSGTQWTYGALEGVGDPVQGGWTFFPSLKWCGSGLAIVEMLLPADLSTGNDEPSKAKFLLSCKKVKTFTGIDGSGVLIEGPATAEPNNGLVLLDMGRFDAKMPLARFHGQTWLDFIARCDGQIPWTGGNVASDVPIWQAVVNFTALSGGQLTKTGGVNSVWDARAASLGFPAGTKISIQIKAGSGTFGFGISASQTIVDPALCVFSLQAAKPVGPFGFVLTQKGSGVNHDLSVWSEGDSLSIMIEDNGAGGLRFNAKRNGITLPLVTIPAVPNTTLFINFCGYSTGSGCQSASISPSGTVATPRSISRFDAHVVFTGTTPFATAWESVMFRAPGADWQDVNGKIKMLPGPDRAPVHTFGPSNILDDDSFKVYARSPEDKFNFYRMRFRSLDDPFLAYGFAEADRPDLRAAIGGSLNDSGLMEGGVMRQSLGDRIVETLARLGSDLDRFWELTAFPDSYHVTKGDFVLLVEEIAGYPAETPALGMVLSERFNFDKGDTKSYLIQSANPAFYSDTDHGVIPQLVPSGRSGQLIPPPPLASLDLQWELRPLPDGSSSMTIAGTAIFQGTAQQYGRVYWKRPGDADFQPTHILLKPDVSTLSDSFFLDSAIVGLHTIRVVTETLLGIVSTSTPVENTVNVYPVPQTLIKFFDNVPPRDNIEDWGITIGAGPGGAGQWEGYKLWRDRGYGYERLGPAITRASTMGHSTNNGISWLGDGSGGSYAIAYLILESGALVAGTFTDADIAAGRSNFFWGREKIGFKKASDLGGGLWKLELPVRGLTHTDIFQADHTAQENVILLDEAAEFIPIERRDIGQVINFKPETFGLALAATTVNSFTPRGDSLRPFAGSEFSAIRESSKYWYFAAAGNPRLQERPETYVLRLRNPVNGLVLRDIPINPVLNSKFSGILTKVPAPPDGLGLVIDRNNISLVGDYGLAAVQVEQIVSSGVQLTAKMFAPGTAETKIYTDATDTYLLTMTRTDDNNSHFKLTYSGGSILESDVPTLDATAWVMIAVVGTMVKIWVATSGVPVPGAIAPLFAVKKPSTISDVSFFCSIKNVGSKIENIWLDGLQEPQTIYTLAQNEADLLAQGVSAPTAALGSPSIDAEMWQTSPYSEIGNKGFSVRKVFP